MRNTFVLLLIYTLATSKVCGQSFTVSDLIKLSSLPSKNIDHFMNKNGYAVCSSKLQTDSMEAIFSIKVKEKKTYIGPKRTINISFKKDSKTFTLFTSSIAEFRDGLRQLSKSDFFYDTKKDVTKDSIILFQKGNMTIETTITLTEDSVYAYCFKLKTRKIPVNVKYAEDLLQFDSHEFLVSFFGEQNVKKDLYYFSDKELQKCSVLFSGSRYQVVFVWGDENNLNNLSYILVPHILPTVSGEKENAVTGSNEWQFQNGIYPGMAIKELLRLNETDFSIYGNKSDLAFMVKPTGKGKIDFTKTAVTLTCNSCDDLKMFNQQQVSALEVTKKDIPMYINDVVIYPSHQ